MKSRNVVFPTICLLISLAALFAYAAPADAADPLPQLIKRHHGVWPNVNLPLNYAIEDGKFNNQEIHAITSAFKTWEEVDSRLKFVKVAYSGQALPDILDPNSGVVLVTRKSMMELRPFIETHCFNAKSYVTWRKDEKVQQIAGGTIILNDQPAYGELFGHCFSAEWRTSKSSVSFYDVKSIMLHEIGHVIGLDHPHGKIRSHNIENTIMGRIDINEVVGNLYDADKNALKFLYGTPEDYR